MFPSHDPKNLIELTIEEHAEAHRKLYEKYGDQNDYIAWKALSGQITSAEARVLAVKNANTGRKQSAEHIAKRMKARNEWIKKNGGPTKGKILPAASEERKRKISKANHGKAYRGTGWKHSEETRRKMSEAAKNRSRSPSK